MASYSEKVVVTFASILTQRKAEELDLRLTSAYRTPEYNEEVGGDPNSNHVNGRAYDFAGDWAHMDALATWAKESRMFTNVIWQEAGHYDHVHVTWPASISRGARGYDVGEVQTILKDLDYYTGKIDDSFGPLTDKAVRDFQGDQQITVDGKIGPVTTAKLRYAETQTKQNYPLPDGNYYRQKHSRMKLEEVKQIQRALNAVNFIAGQVDGYYGPKTEDAVRRFQSMYADLENDGIFGPNTKAKLMRKLVS